MAFEFVILETRCFRHPFDKLIIYSACSQKNLFFLGLKPCCCESRKSSDTFDETSLESSQENNPS